MIHLKKVSGFHPRKMNGCGEHDSRSVAVIHMIQLRKVSGLQHDSERLMAVVSSIQKGKWQSSAQFRKVSGSRQHDSERSVAVSMVTAIFHCHKMGARRNCPQSQSPDGFRFKCLTYDDHSGRSKKS